MAPTPLFFCLLFVLLFFCCCCWLFFCFFGGGEFLYSNEYISNGLNYSVGNYYTAQILPASVKSCKISPLCYWYLITKFNTQWKNLEFAGFTLVLY